MRGWPILDEAAAEAQKRELGLERWLLAFVLWRWWEAVEMTWVWVWD